MREDYIVLKKFVNIFLRKGKKATAVNIALSVIKFLNIKNKKKVTGEEVIIKSVDNLKPQVHVEKQRKSRRIFFLPKLIKSEKKIGLALH